MELRKVDFFQIIRSQKVCRLKIIRRPRLELILCVLSPPPCQLTHHSITCTVLGKKNKDDKKYKVEECEDNCHFFWRPAAISVNYLK